jgi:hypothetical protein
MKTEELVALLATGSGAVETHVALRRYTLAVASGLIGAALLMVSLLKVRADLAEAALLPLFWLKIGFVASLLVASLFATVRLSRPGARTARLPVAMATPIVLMWTVATFVLYVAEPEARAGLFLGQTWQSCPLLIALLSAPALVAVIWAMKGLAPTRPRLAGFAAGLLSGAMAALVYCLHCPELEAPFVGFWYLLGILIPAIAGAWLGEKLLRW